MTRARVEKYSNERLRARRARILQTAREIIGEKGVDGLNMRELAEKSGVALATLYNIYGSKDVLVSYAVNDFLESILETTVQKTARQTSLDRLLTLIDMIGRDVKKSASYTLVVVALYFKSGRDQGVHDMLYKIGLSKFSEVLDNMREDAGYAEWVSIEMLADEMTEQVLWRILQWSRDSFPDRLLGDHMRLSALQILAGVTSGPMHGEIVRQLRLTTEKLAKVRNKKT